MRKIKLYIAISLNGKIARPNGDVDWLDAIPNPEKMDYGYYQFYDSIDTTIQGYNTYAKVLSWGIEFPYGDKKNYVLTRKQNIDDSKDVTFIKNDHIDFVKNIKHQEGKDIWLIGGGQVNTMLFNENLIDEILMFVMPIVIPDGIDLFGSNPLETHLKLLETKSYSTGVVEMRYGVIRDL